jgi:hypothetical protein
MNSRLRTVEYTAERPAQPSVFGGLVVPPTLISLGAVSSTFVRPEVLSDEEKWLLAVLAVGPGGCRRASGRTPSKSGSWAIRNLDQRPKTGSTGVHLLLEELVVRSSALLGARLELSAFVSSTAEVPSATASHSASSWDG